MSIIIMMALLSTVEAIGTTFIDIKNSIVNKIKWMIFRRNSRRRRAGYRADFKTRVRYKLESMYDELITPK